MSDLPMEAWSGMVIRAIEHRRQYAAEKVFKEKTTAQFEDSLNGKLAGINGWVTLDEKASECAGSRDTSIGVLSAAITEYNDSIAGEFGEDSEAYRKRPSVPTRIEAWEAEVIRAIEHRRKYASNKVFKEMTTAQWEALLQSNLQKIKDWIEGDEKANQQAGTRDTAIAGLKAEIREYNKSIAGEFGKKSEAYKKRVRVNRPESKSSTSTGTQVDPSH